MNPTAVYIILPVWQEEEVLSKTVTSLLPLGYSVVVVDDGSSPEQLLYIKSLPVHYLRHEINLGQGAALQTGVEYALDNGAKWIVHFDADGQHIPSDIPKLLEPLLNNETDVVLGSRFSGSSHYPVPTPKRILLFMARYVHYLFTRILLTDAHNGLRAMNKKAALLLTIKENRMSHASELLFSIKKHRLRFKEVGVTVVYNKYSTSKGQSSWNGIRIGFDLLLYKLFH
jgi:polyprenyl-phospho-N-acetylgalactosaminyl synthase